MNTYRLLRSNKESGPFSFEELLSKGLKPYDLVWVENRSAAWRYPSEIAELKPHAPVTEEQPFDRFFKRSSENKAAETPEKKQKPRFRITAVSKKIEPQQQITNTPDPVLPSEHKAYIPKQEAHVSGSLATFNHYSNTEKKYEQTPILETKYTESLDDIKRRYSEKILTEKKKSFVSKYSWMLIIPVLAAGIWFGYQISAKAETKGLAQVPKPVMQTVNISPDTFQSVTKTEETIQAAEKAPEEKPAFIPHNAVVTKPNVQNRVTADNSSAERTATSAAIKKNTEENRQINPAKDEIILPAPDKTTTSTGSYPQVRQPRVRNEEPKQAESNTEVKTPVKETASSTVASSKPTSKSKRIEDYVVVDGAYKKNTDAIENLSLKVENVTTYPLDLVVVDIQYFDKNGRLQKGETVYAKNIAPRRDVVVSAPSGPKAYSVGYKVSLISAEKAGLYVVAE